MGTIAARDALRVIELTEQVLAAVMLGGAQAWDLRARESRPAGEALSSELGDFTRTIRTYSAFVEEDRPLEGDLRALLNAIRRRDIQVEL
jgi:histidine ammonia-lyase